MKKQRNISAAYARQLLVLLFFVVSQWALAAPQQDDNASKLLRLFEKQKVLFPQEKVYMHLDKPYYMVGDTIWFAGYVTNAITNAPSNISSVLLVDLISSSAQMVAQYKWKIDSGFTNGQIELNDTLKQDTYTLRAYTAWMCNFDSCYFSSKQVNVFQPIPTGFRCQAAIDSSALTLKMMYNGSSPRSIKKCPVKYKITSSKFSTKGNAVIDDAGNIVISQKIKNQNIANATVELEYTDNDKNKQKTTVPFKLPCSSEVRVTFFPEGGEMVEGLSSRVAFEVRDGKGQPILTKGYVKSMNEAMQVESNFAGYGAFAVMAQKNMADTLSIRYHDTDYNFPLPQPQAHGAIITCTYLTHTELKIRVQGKFNRPEQGQNMLLVGHVRGDPMFIAPINLNSSGTAQAKILTSLYPQGVMQLTLIDGIGIPCAERLIYIDKGERVNIKIDAPTTIQKVKTQTALNITTTNQSGTPVTARLSLSAVDTSQLVLPDSTDENIYSYLLLSSELKGRIYRPGYYFSGAPSAKKDLDLLMLTQGWRRFTLDLCMVDSLCPIKYPVEKNIALMAHVAGVNKKKIKDYSTTLVTYGSDNKIYSISRNSPNQNGNLSFVFDDFYGDLKVLLSTRNQRDRLTDVDMKLMSSPQPGCVPLESVEDLNFIALQNQKILDQRTLLGSTDLDNAIVLKDIVVAGARKDYTSEDMGHLATGTIPDVVIEQKDIAGLAMYGSLLHIIQYFAPEFRETRDTIGNLECRVKGSAVFGKDALVEFWVDQAPQEAEFLNSIDPKSVTSIRIYKSSILSATPLVAISTTTLPVGIVATVLKGFEKSKEFYTPLDIENQRFNYRSTIFWKANIETDANGRATCIIPNTNNATTVKLRAEGLTQSGMPAFGEAKYQVIK